jgi:hypothetical protein
VSILNLAARSWSRWAAALAALVLVVTAVAAGARYVICARTGTTHSHPCCAKRHAAGLAKAESKAPRGAEVVAAGSCCESQVVPASGAAAVELALPGVVAMPAALPQEAWSLRDSRPPANLACVRSWPIRAGPAGNVERLALLQVFLI